MSDDARMVRYRKRVLRGAVAIYVLWVGILATLVVVSSVEPPVNPARESAR
jgi:hypothetical protein